MQQAYIVGSTWYSSLFLLHQVEAVLGPLQTTLKHSLITIIIGISLGGRILRLKNVMPVLGLLFMDLESCNDGFNDL